MNIEGRRAKKICIVGGGIAGLAAGWSLTRLGYSDVEVVEAEAQLCSQASSQNAAIYRPLETDVEISRLAHRNLELMAVLQTNGNASLIDKRGILFLDDRLDSLLAHADVAERLQVPYEWVNSPSRDWPKVASELPLRYRGIYCPEGGVLDVHEMAERLRVGAIQAGVRITLNERVVLDHREDNSGPRVVGLKTGTGRRIPASAVVLAAGAGAGICLQETSLSAPLLPLKRHLALLGPTRRERGEPIVWQLHPEIYFRGETGGVLVSPCDESPCPSGFAQRDLAALYPMYRRLGRLNQRIANEAVRCFWAGLRTKSLDGRPLIGPDHRIRGLYWLGGLGGFGMSTALAASEVLARLIDTHACEPLFCPQRFELSHRVTPQRHLSDRAE